MSFITTTKDQQAYPRLLTIAYSANNNTQTIISSDLVGCFNVYVNNVYINDSLGKASADPKICAFLSNQIRQTLQQFDTKNITGAVPVTWAIQPYDFNFMSQAGLGRFSNPCHLGIFQFNGSFDIRTVNVATNLFPATTNWIGYEFYLEYLGRDMYNLNKPSIPKFIEPSEYSYCINISGDANINNIQLGIRGDYIMEIAQYSFNITEPNQPSLEMVVVITSPQFLTEGCSALDILPNSGGLRYNPSSLIFHGYNQHQIFCEPYKIPVRLDGVLQIVACRNNGTALTLFAGGYAVISLLVNLKRRL